MGFPFEIIKRKMLMPSSTSPVHVRRLEVNDFSFVRELAAEQPNFTIPPPYVLWLLLRLKGAICLVAEDKTGVSLAYLLAVPIAFPDDSLFVWQIAATRKQHRTNPMLAVLRAFQNVARELGVTTIVFSSLPGTAVFRLLSRYAVIVFGSEPVCSTVLPAAVAPDESEFVITLR